MQGVTVRRRCRLPAAGLRRLRRAGPSGPRLAARHGALIHPSATSPMLQGVPQGAGPRRLPRLQRHLGRVGRHQAGRQGVPRCWPPGWMGHSCVRSGGASRCIQPLLDPSCQRCRRRPPCAAPQVLHTIQELWLDKEPELTIVPDLFADLKARAFVAFLASLRGGPGPCRRWHRCAATLRRAASLLPQVWLGPPSAEPCLHDVAPVFLAITDAGGRRV